MTDEVAPVRNPHLKAMLRDALSLAVYGPLSDELQTRLDAIIVQNMQHGSYRDGFISFRGHVWRHSLYATAPEPVLVMRPVKPLQAAMLAWQTEQLELEEEHRLVGHSITAVLNAVTDPADLFKIFPEFLHNNLQKVLDEHPMQPPFRPLTDEQVAALKTKQGPCLSLLKQRLMWALIKV